VLLHLLQTLGEVALIAFVACVLGFWALRAALSFVGKTTARLNLPAPRAVFHNVRTGLALVVGEVGRALLPAPAATEPPVAAIHPARREGSGEPDCRAHLSDLTLVRGVGARTAAILRDMGIQSVADLARLDARTVETIERRLGFRGRIAREGWVEQARWLVGEDQAA